nr:hypothetical protein BaRGS_025488 [Batillaria attramentaria]
MRVIHVERSTARGVLSIKLLSFENPKGRTYEGQCCDPSPLDGDTCHDKCDYVMRLIIAGLGRHPHNPTANAGIGWRLTCVVSFVSANDHVFLFHRPLKYDSNDLHFQEHGGGDLTLTVLYDQWPSEGHVKMNAFFYDYDDFDHTTALVDWVDDICGVSGQRGTSQHKALIASRKSNKFNNPLVFQWSRHCVGGLEDDEDCPSASTNLAQEDLVFPGEHGQLSGEGRQQLFYQHKNEEAHPMKSPFRPFSTRKNNLDLHRLISSHSPDIMNDGYGQVTAGPGPSRGHGVRSEYQHKHNRQRQESVFVEDPLRIVKESKAEKYLDTDLTEDSSKPRHHQKAFTKLDEMEVRAQT